MSDDTASSDAPAPSPEAEVNAHELKVVTRIALKDVPHGSIIRNPNDPDKLTARLRGGCGWHLNGTVPEIRADDTVCVGYGWPWDGKWIALRMSEMVDVVATHLTNQQIREAAIAEALNVSAVRWVRDHQPTMYQVASVREVPPGSLVTRLGEITSGYTYTARFSHGRGWYINGSIVTVGDVHERGWEWSFPEGDTEYLNGNVQVTRLSDADLCAITAAANLAGDAGVADWLTAHGLTAINAVKPEAKTISSMTGFELLGDTPSCCVIIRRRAGEDFNRFTVRFADDKAWNLESEGNYNSFGVWTWSTYKGGDTRGRVLVTGLEVDDMLELAVFTPEQMVAWLRNRNIDVLLKDAVETS